MASLSELTKQRDRIIRQLGRSTQQVSVDGTTTVAPALRDQLDALRHLEEEIEQANASLFPWKDYVANPPGAVGDFA